jgi:hypothetical protein
MVFLKRNGDDRSCTLRRKVTHSTRIIHSGRTASILNGESADDILQAQTQLGVFATSFCIRSVRDGAVNRPPLPAQAPTLSLTCTHRRVLPRRLSAICPSSGGQGYPPESIGQNTFHIRVRNTVRDTESSSTLIGSPRSVDRVIEHDRERHPCEIRNQQYSCRTTDAGEHDNGGNDCDPQHTDHDEPQTSSLKPEKKTGVQARFSANWMANVPNATRTGR